MDKQDFLNLIDEHIRSIEASYTLIKFRSFRKKVEIA